jgi:hypothetical protein
VSDEQTTWADVARTMSDYTDKPVDDPAITEAIVALQTTKLRPSFVLDEWNRAASTAALGPSGSEPT